MTTTTTLVSIPGALYNAKTVVRIKRLLVNSQTEALDVRRLLYASADLNIHEALQERVGMNPHTTYEELCGTRFERGTHGHFYPPSFPPHVCGLYRTEAAESRAFECAPTCKLEKRDPVVQGGRRREEGARACAWVVEGGCGGEGMCGWGAGSFIGRMGARAGGCISGGISGDPRCTTCGASYVCSKDL